MKRSSCAVEAQPAGGPRFGVMRRSRTVNPVSLLQSSSIVPLELEMSVDQIIASAVRVCSLSLICGSVDERRAVPVQGVLLDYGDDPLAPTFHFFRI